MDDIESEDDDDDDNKKDKNKSTDQKPESGTKSDEKTVGSDAANNSPDKSELAGNDSGKESPEGAAKEKKEKPVEKRKKNHRNGAITRALAMFGLEDQEEIKAKLEEHLSHFNINERFGIWDRKLLHLAVGKLVFG